MVLGEALDVILERVDTRRSDNPGLAHGAAELVLETPGAVDEVRGAGEHRTDRRPQPLGETDPRRVEGLGIVARRDAARHHRVHQAGAIEVGAKAGVPGGTRDLLNALERPNRPAAAVRGVLHRQQA